MSRWLKLALLLVGGLAILLIAFLGSAVVSDCVRSVKQPGNYAAVWEPSDIREALDLLEKGSSAQEDEDGFVEGATPAAEPEDRDKKDAPTPSRLAPLIRPVPDLAMVMGGKEEEARQWNAETDKLAARLLQVLYEAKSMNVEEAIERMRLIDRDFHDVSNRGPDNTIFITHPDGSWGPASPFPRWREQYEGVFTAVLLQHEA
ncbi:MAG TPA: hypothetical protein VM492_05215 [Sumerlaeia bacterium]|nr:hypothetical protein [Sumerlaeia bacterium]